MGCSPVSGNCYDWMGKSYYRSCAGSPPSPPSPPSPTSPPSRPSPVHNDDGCCSSCRRQSKPFCSPVSGNCYDWMGKSYYRSCAGSPPSPPGPPGPVHSGEQLRFKADSRYCLSVDANRFYNGQNVQLWECSRSSGQLFVWANGLIQVANAPRYCVVVDGNENRDGA